MNLPFPVSVVFGVQLYWLSIVVIGYICVVALQRLTRDRFISNWSQLPFVAHVVVSVATAFGLFGVYTLVGYALLIPGWWLGVTYLGSLFLAVVAGLTVLRRTVIADCKKLWRAALSIKLLSPSGILLLVLVGDFILSLYMGSFMVGDAPVHISKLRHLLEHGFTLEDAYFGGVPETRHHLSVLHTLMAVPTWFGVAAERSWFLAVSFLKLCKILVVYYLGWRLSEKYSAKTRTAIASSCGLIAIGLFSTYAIGLPTYFAPVWVVLLTIGLLDVMRGKNYWLVIMTSCLIALTHSLIALSAVVLLAFIGIGILLFNRPLLSKKLLLTFLASVVLLLSTPLFTFMLPNRMTEAAKNTGADKLHYIHLGGQQAFKPEVAQITGIEEGSVILVSLAALGMVMTLLIVKKRGERIVLASALLVLPLILYNPFSFTVLNKILPAWGIQRLAGANQLYLVFVPFGIVLLAELSSRLLSRLRITLPASLPTTAVFCCALIILPLTQTHNALRRGEHAEETYYDRQRITLADMADIKKLAPTVTDVVVMADDPDSIRLPALSPVHVLAVRDSRATPAADANHRLQCQKLLSNKLEAAVFKQADVSFVLAKIGTELDDAAKTKPYLRPVNHTSRRVLYQFTGQNAVVASTKQCTFNE